jgi:hypothetical protein
MIGRKSPLLAPLTAPLRRFPGGRTLKLPAWPLHLHFQIAKVLVCPYD